MQDALGGVPHLVIEHSRHRRPKRANSERDLLSPLATAIEKSFAALGEVNDLLYFLGTSTVATACAAMPSPRPVKPRPSEVVALTLIRYGLDSGDPGDACRASPGVRPDLRRLADQGAVEVGDGVAAGGNALEALARNPRRPRPSRRGRTVGTTGRCRLRRGPRERVGDRVHADVGVGVADEALSERDSDAAESDGAAGAEGVHVEAETGADVLALRSAPPSSRPRW